MGQENPLTTEAADEQQLLDDVRAGYGDRTLNRLAQARRQDWDRRTRR